MDPLQKKPYVKAGHEGKLDRRRWSGQGRIKRRRRRRKRASGSSQLNEASEKPSKPRHRSSQQLRILNTNSEMFTHPRAAPGTHVIRADVLRGRRTFRMGLLSSGTTKYIVKLNFFYRKSCHEREISQTN